MRSLLWANLKCSPVRSFQQIFAIAFLAAILALIFSSLHLLSQGLEEGFLKSFPKDEVRVTMAPLNLGPLKMKVGSARFSEKVLEKIKKMKGVRYIGMATSLALPARGIVKIWGRTYWTDVGVIGVDTALVKDVARIVHFKKKGKEIPAIISIHLLELLNSGLASANHLPQLNSSFIQGKTFELKIGESSLWRHPKGSHSYRCKISGFTQRSDLLGLLIPRNLALQWMKEYGESAQASDYLYLKIEKGPVGEKARKTLQKNGFLLTTAGKQGWKSIQNLFQTLRIAAWFLSGLFLFLGIFLLHLLFSTIARERKEETKLFYFLGATRRKMLQMAFQEVFFLSGFGLIAGLAASYLSGRILWAYLSRLSQWIPFWPKIEFTMGLELYIPFLILTGFIFLDSVIVSYKAIERTIKA